VAVALVSACSCLYLPPVHHTAGDRTLERAQAEAVSRDAMAAEIGRADVIRTRAVWVHDWNQSYGYVVLGYGGGELTGKPHRVLVRFDGDVVAAMEIAAPPPLTPAAPETARLSGCAGDDERRVVIAIASGGGTTAAIDSRGGLCVWKDLAREGRLVVPLVGREKKRLPLDAAVAVSPDGQLVAAASEDAVVVWSVAEGRVVAEATRPRASVPFAARRTASAAFSPDGAWLAVAGPDSLLVFDCRSWELAWSIVEGPELVGVAFTPDGTRLACSDLTGRLLDYDAATGALLAEVGERRSPYPELLPLDVPADPAAPRTLLVAGRVALETWDLDGLERRFESTGAAAPILDDVEIPELADVRLMPLPALPWRVEFAWRPVIPCGRSVAAAPDGRFLAEQLCSEVRLFRLPGLEFVTAYDAVPREAGNRSPRPGPVAFTTDGRHLLQAIGADVVVRDFPLAAPSPPYGHARPLRGVPSLLSPSGPSPGHRLSARVR